MILTVFTPLYNRERSIYEVYDSLQKQTTKEFVWLVINDGSTDRSGEIMEKIIANHGDNFKIRYIVQKNLGLTRTINKAVSITETPLIYRLDSDDIALPNAVESILKYYPMVDSKSYAALVFLSLNNQGKIVGYHPFSVPTICNFSSYRDKYKAKGDRAEVMKTEIYKNYLFPELDNEKFCPEGLVWNRIAQKYSALYICEPIYQKGCPDDSITADVYNYLKRNCKGTSLYYYEIVTNNSFSFSYRLENLIRYYRYAPYAKSPLIKGIPLLLLLLGGPVGFIVFVCDYLRG